MEEIIGWGVAVFAVLLSIWGLVKFIGTKNEDVGAFVEKAEPYVDTAVDVAERATGEDLDGDGSVG